MFDTTRKFKSACGNTLEVHITKGGAIRSIQKLDFCQDTCAACVDRTAKIRELIASGK